VTVSTEAPPVSLSPPPPAESDKPLPINLPTALRLANVAPVEIALAAQRIRVAVAVLQRAEVLWLPTLYTGVDYFRHDGQIQDVAGNIFGTSKGALIVGTGPTAVFAVSDAIFGPLVERQVVRARQAELQTARNDSLGAVAEAYFNVQQARGELAGAIDAARRAEAVFRKTERLTQGQAARIEAVRARTELAHRRQVVQSAHERWRLASAELARLLRLDPAVLVEPMEPPHLQVRLIAPEHTLDDLIPLGLTSRPELAAQQALVQATIARLRQERLRPWVPSVFLRGAATNPAGILAAGEFGGGRNGSIGNFSFRSDFDVEVLWEWQNLGLGNLARINERRAENQLANLDFIRIRDRVAAEIAQALAQVRSAEARVGEAQSGLRDAVESANRNYEGLGQTMAAGRLEILLIRPQEVVQSVQALAQAYIDYYGAVADYNRAQFRLYRAVGRPAQLLATEEPDCSAAPADYAPPAVKPGPDR
jgi:outer membrane protein TolC